MAGLPQKDGVEPIVMPKWGLAMQEGMLAEWHVEEGATIAKGQEIMDIETSKIANVFESPIAGVLRRRVVTAGETVPVGALLAVCAESSVADADLDAYVTEFQANFVPETDDEAGGPEPQFVDVQGRRLRYVRQGEGQGSPVLFIHGFGGDYLTWMFNQPVLAEANTTYALELPGHGASSKDVGEASVDFMTATVVGFMDALDIAKAHLVAHSLGGAIILDLASRHGDRAASLTMVCPAGLGPDINMTFIEGFMREKRGKKLKPFLEMLVADPAAVTREMIEEVLKYKRLDGVEAALGKIAAACFDGGQQSQVLRDKLDGIAMPVQVIWGAEDRIVPPSHAAGLPASIKVALVANAGHIVQMEKSGEVNALLQGWIAR